MVNKKVDIVYYSGTGGTKRVAEAFKDKLKESMCDVNIKNISEETEPISNKGNILIVLFPVHASNAPLPVLLWLHELDYTYSKAAVISVSGGGEMSPNTASREASIKVLQGKGIDVFYENMIVMPTNLFSPTPELVALKLLEILPKKVSGMVESILKGKRRRVMPLFIDQLLSPIFEIEKTGAKILGSKMVVNEDCNGCSWCANACSTHNIKMIDDRPSFNHSCTLCMKCIYGCPKKAISLKVFNSAILKDGYDLERLEAKLPLEVEVDINKEAKGILWLGVRKYLYE